MSDHYQGQDRGEAGAYERYLAGMDASMRQKVALTAAHLLCEGDVADMGMGSGSGSFALAALYPDLRVVGVDVNPEMVARAAERYQLPNLRFVVGDIAQPCFEAGTQEAILDSSVLHHVTSFGGYDRAAALRAVAVQADQLAAGGVLVVRDFLDPGPGTVWLDLPTTDGDEPPREAVADPRTCSTAALFERFATEFRSLLEPGARGFRYQQIEAVAGCPLTSGFRRFAVDQTHAAEFVLRKDYRRDWELEVKEEYTYGTRDELEAGFERLGLRVLASTPIRNPWIVAHRLEGKVALWSTAGRALDLPATNYVIVGQKVPASEGVRFRVVAEVAPTGYLARSFYRRVDDTQEVRDLIRRPGITVDVIPWFETGGVLRVLARRSFPRPLLSIGRADGATVSGCRPPVYVTEPLNVQQVDKPLGQTVDELLEGFAEIGAARVLSFAPGGEYYPSPGGMQEEVRSVLVAIAPVNVDAPIGHHSLFSTAGQLRAIEARQLLRAAQVGGLPDARLELNVYELLLAHSRDPGPWIGAAIELEETPAVVPTAMAELASRPHRRRFRVATAAESTGFLDLRAVEFEELDGGGARVGHGVLEAVVPRHLSLDTVAAAVVRRAGGRLLLGIDDDDLPAAQCFTGNSELLVAPAWRLPVAVTGLGDAWRFVRARLAAEYGVEAGRIRELGGSYCPSPGVTPEVVVPIAVEVIAETVGERTLTWVELSDVVAHRGELRDGHLRIVAMRAAHALGLLGSA